MSIKTILLFTSLILFLTVNTSKAQGNLEVLGSVMLDGKGVEGAEIKIKKGNEEVDKVVTSNGGKYILNLDLNAEYTIIFSKTGAISKSVMVDTKVPPSAVTTVFSFKFKIDLFKQVEGVDAGDKLDKPVAKIGYSELYEDFDYDQKYSAARKSELEALKGDYAKAAAEKEKARLAALEQARKDSIANAKFEAAKRATELALLAAAEKATQDSLAKVAAEEKRAENLRIAAAAAAKQATEDSLMKIKVAEEKARLQAEALARQDSINNAKIAADAKAKADALEKQKLAALEKAKQDSIAKAEIAAKAILAAQAKLTQDSIANAKKAADA